MLARLATLSLAALAAAAIAGAPWTAPPAARESARAAEPLLGALDAHHGHRRFRRDPFDLAEPVLVEHHVADDEHRIGGQGGRRHELAVCRWARTRMIRGLHRQASGLPRVLG